ncbi:hypothetical protein EJV47_14830 [Hymenobacter gummosus]|uniref:Tetratricopeptide repeat protein n=1 Tax=Hymenobacter gummosus TaxID=1776032 RepID=A0A431U187_9BACT|nr:hypothetical protein [Hymenobacter gummosus]RTQ48869.1 hypothetical protein EJV47_14830 [Hymenobacter gummosus]
MGLFDFFKRQPAPAAGAAPSPAQAAYETAQQHYQAEDYPAALKALAEGFQQDVDFRPLYPLTIEVLGQLGAEEEQQLFRTVQQDFQRPEPFAELGSYFVSQLEQHYYALAEPFLRKAQRLAPGSVDVAHDLALCYARQFQVQRAYEELSRVAYQQDFWAWYFYQKLSILLGRTAEVPAALAAIRADIPADADPIVPLKLTELREMVARYQAVGQPRPHIRDWQFIQYGSAVLDCFEPDADDEYVAGGRYVALWLSMENIRGILGALAQLLAGLGARVEAVAALPDRDSQIVAEAAARVLSLPLLDYEPALTERPLLVVAADSASFGEYEELATAQPGQVLFALNHHWLQPARFSPDVIGLMSQLGGLPWDGSGMRLVEAEGEEPRVEHIPADERPAADIGRELAEAAPADVSFDLEFYRRHRAYLKGFGTDAGPHRFHFMTESPVPGSYFN